MARHKEEVTRYGPALATYYGRSEDFLTYNLRMSKEDKFDTERESTFCLKPNSYLETQMKAADPKARAAEGQAPPTLLVSIFTMVR